MLATDAKNKTLTVKEKQEALARKHVAKYLKKIFKLVTKATKRGESSIYFVKDQWIGGYSHYWETLAKELSEELTLRGFTNQEYEYFADEPTGFRKTNKPCACINNDVLLINIAWN